MTTMQIDAINALLEGTTIAPIAAPKPARKPKAAKLVKGDYATTPGQFRRIANAEEAILASGRKRGIALIKREPARTIAMATGLSASAYYKTLAAFTQKHGIRF
jgi:hypothetical protein